MAADDLTVDFTASAEAEEHQHAPIAFPEPEEEEHEPSRLDVEREKHKARCVPRAGRWTGRRCLRRLPRRRRRRRRAVHCCSSVFPARSAAKFQVDYVEPEKRPDLRLDARKERFNRPGFATGVDIFTAEEQAKLAQRAARFGLPEDSGLAWKPPQVGLGWGGWEGACGVLTFCTAQRLAPALGRRSALPRPLVLSCLPAPARPERVGKMAVHPPTHMLILAPAHHPRLRSVLPQVPATLLPSPRCAGHPTPPDTPLAALRFALILHAPAFTLPRSFALQADPDAEKKRQRAARFGVEYVPKDETGLMDVGASGCAGVPGGVGGGGWGRGGAAAATVAGLACCTPLISSPSHPTFSLSSSDLFEARRDPSAAVPRRPEAVHMYGVDLMSTNDCLKYFADYGGWGGWGGGGGGGRGGWQAMLRACWCWMGGAGRAARGCRQRCCSLASQPSQENTPNRAPPPPPLLPGRPQVCGMDQRQLSKREGWLLCGRGPCGGSAGGSTCQVEHPATGTAPAPTHMRHPCLYQPAVPCCLPPHNPSRCCLLTP